MSYLTGLLLRSWCTYPSTRPHGCGSRVRSDIACQKFPQLGPPPSLSYATNSDAHRTLLTDQDNQPGAASDPGVKQVSLQHGVMLGQDRDDDAAGYSEPWDLWMVVA